MKREEAMQEVKNSMKNVNSMIKDFIKSGSKDQVAILSKLSVISREVDKIDSLKEKAGCSERELYFFSLNIAELSGWFNSASQAKYMYINWDEVMPKFRELEAKFDALRGKQDVEIEKQ